MQTSKSIVDITTHFTKEGLPITFYNQVVQVYTKSQNVTLVKNCIGYMFTNVGDANASVNGMVIYPFATPGAGLGDSRSIMGHPNHIYVGNLTLAITPNTALPGVEIVQLFI